MLQPFMRTLLIAAAAIAAPLVADAALCRAMASDAVVLAAGASAQTVKVGLNKSLVIDLPRDARDILVSNPGIADAVIRTPTRIYVTGVTVGQSNVIVFDRAGQQIVSLDLQVERDATDLSRMIARLVPNSNVNVEIVSDNVILSGTVKNASDARKVQDIVGAFANGGAQAQSGGGGGGSAGGSGSSGGGSSGAGSSGSGSSGGGSGSQGVSISLATTGGSGPAPSSKVINMLAIEGEDQVMIKVTVAEVNRNLIKQLGIDWNAQNLNLAGLLFSAATHLPFAVNNNPPTNALTLSSSQGQLTASVKALEQTGLFKTLAEPTLTAISGEVASFLAGGEFPVPTGIDDKGNVTVTFKPFGVALGFTPVVLSEGRISLRVKTEVSALSQDGALKLSGLTLPSLKVRRAETTLELPSGGSMVLGGMLEDNAGQAIAAVPGLGKLPILGPLFRSRDFQSNQTELVIVVTPFLVKPAPMAKLTLPTTGLDMASDAQSMLLGNINRVYGTNGAAPDASYQYRGQFGFIYQ